MNDRADTPSETRTLREAAQKVLDAWDHQSTEAACWAVHIDLRAALAATGPETDRDLLQVLLEATGNNCPRSTSRNCSSG